MASNAHVSDLRDHQQGSSNDLNAEPPASNARNSDARSRHQESSDSASSRRSSGSLASRYNVSQNLSSASDRSGQSSSGAHYSNTAPSDNDSNPTAISSLPADELSPLDIFRRLSELPSSRTIDGLAVVDLIRQYTRQSALVNDEDGCNYIMVAARKWNRLIATKLIPVSNLMHTDKENKTLIHHIILKDPRFLYKPNEICEFLSTVLTEIEKYPTSSNFIYHKDRNGATALMLCVQHDQPNSSCSKLSLARLLVEKGRPQSFQGGRSEPLYIDYITCAYIEAIKEAKIQMVELLYDELSNHGCDIPDPPPDASNRVLELIERKRGMRTESAGYRTSIRRRIARVFEHQRFWLQ